MLKDTATNTLRHTRRFRETRQAEYGAHGVDLGKRYSSEGEVIAEAIEVTLDDEAAAALATALGLSHCDQPDPDG